MAKIAENGVHLFRTVNTHLGHISRSPVSRRASLSPESLTKAEFNETTTTRSQVRTIIWAGATGPCEPSMTPKDIPEMQMAAGHGRPFRG